MVESISCVKPISSAQRKISHFVWDDAVWIAINHNDFIALFAMILNVVGVIGHFVVTPVYHAWVCHLNVGRWLEIYVR